MENHEQVKQDDKNSSPKVVEVKLPSSTSANSTAMSSYNYCPSLRSCGADIFGRIKVAVHLIELASIMYVQFKALRTAWAQH